MKINRVFALEYLLRPIALNKREPISVQRKHVNQRHIQVDSAYPFLTPEEQILADQWREREKHFDLWDRPPHA